MIVGEATLGRTRVPLVAALVVTSALLVSGGRSNPAALAVRVDAAASVGTLQAQLGTQFGWPGTLEQAVETRARFTTLGEPLIRILARTDGCCWPGGPGPMIPAGKVEGGWDFNSLDAVVNDITGAGARPVLAIAYAPEWMWNCETGTIRDPTFGEFGDYMARLVAYYNRGSFVAEDGRTIRNPAGIANRITYWELWNEPDQRALSCPPTGSPNISPAQYVTMWNATTPKMRALDPALTLIGPATANPSAGYITALVSDAIRKPDIVSFHAYGGWMTSQSDHFLFHSRCCGLDAIVSNLAQVRASAPGIPVWITELNVNSAWVSDPTKRAYNAFSAAWGATAFRRLAVGGASAIFQYMFAHPGNPSLSLLDVSTGEPLLPYWRDYYLARYFPPGSTLLASSSSLAGIEILAARAPDSSNVHLLVVNGRVDGPTAVGGPGVPATVEISVANLDGVTQVLARQFDDTTPLLGGPPTTHLTVRNGATVTFSGYGAAILEFITSSPALPSP